MSIRTAECVSPKHPDKICDQVSDGIVDYLLSVDSNARIAVEVMAGHGKVYITGEVSTNAPYEESKFISIAKDLTGIDDVSVNVVKQSPFIAQGVDEGGAGDQGIMVGYACRDNEEFLPQEMYLARSLCKYLYQKFPYDGKTQITLLHQSIPLNITASFQNTSQEELTAGVLEWVHLMRDLGETAFYYQTDKCEIFVNPAGDWTQGGLDADTGLTGRKIVQDAYGPHIPVGGGAFSGKDPTKVDRSGAYLARKMALQILDVSSADEVYVYLAYAIGKKDPVMVKVVEDGVEGYFDLESGDYDFTPKKIIEDLDLRNHSYQKTAEWGAFGNEKFNWEKYW